MSLSSELLVSFFGVVMEEKPLWRSPNASVVLPGLPPVEKLATRCVWMLANPKRRPTPFFETGGHI